MEFYVNHLSSECGEASGKVADEQRRDGGDEEEDDRDKYYYRPRLETVLEETEEELARDRGDEYASLSSGSDDSVDTTSSSSEHWKWGNGWLNGSDDDASTVIDVHLGEFSAPVEFSPQQQRGNAISWRFIHLKRHTPSVGVRRARSNEILKKEKQLNIKIKTQ